MKAGKRALFILFLAFSTLLMGCGSTSKQTNLTLGMTAVGEMKYSEALEVFETALEAGEDIQLVSRGQGLAYMGLTRYDEAKNSFVQALSYSGFFPTSLEYDLNYYLATTYYKLGDYENAITTLDAILGLNRKESNAFYLRGAVKLDAGNFEDAVKDFQQAITLEPKNYDLYISVFQKLEEKGYREEGEKYLQDVIDDQDKSMTEYDKGRVCYYLKDYENARNYLESARDENDGSIMLLLGKTYEALADFNYAVSVYSNYLASHKDAEFYNQLGLCKVHLSDYQGALEAFQAGILLEDSNMKQTLSFNEVVAYEYLGDFKKAAVLMETYMTNYPEDEIALREYEFLISR